MIEGQRGRRIISMRAGKHLIRSAYAEILSALHPGCPAMTGTAQEVAGAGCSAVYRFAHPSRAHE